MCNFLLTFIQVPQKGAQKSCIFLGTISMILKIIISDLNLIFGALHREIEQNCTEPLLWSIKFSIKLFQCNFLPSGSQLPQKRVQKSGIFLGAINDFGNHNRNVNPIFGALHRELEQKCTEPLLCSIKFPTKLFQCNFLTTDSQVPQKRFPNSGIFLGAIGMTLKIIIKI